MLTHLFTTVIYHAFNEKAGKNQLRKPDEEQRGLFMSFGTSIDHEKEEGYRYAELLIFGGLNYVEVWIRTRWCVAPLDPNAGDDDELDYEEGASEWENVCYHDSGWRSAINDFVFKNRNNLQTFSGDLWQLVTPQAIKELGIDLKCGPERLER